MVHFVIPARKGSKGFKNKSRKLVPLLKDRFPKKVRDRIIITTDDPWIQNNFKDSLFRIHKRDPQLAQDDVSIKPVLSDVADHYRFYPDDDICLMYPTYPQRTYENTRDVLVDYQTSNATSMLCCVDWSPDTWTYTLIDRDPETRKASMAFSKERGVYRRQDSIGRVRDIKEFSPKPTYYEYSHFVCIMKVRTLPHLNKNLYSMDQTMFHKLDEKPIDVDTKHDWDEYKTWEQKHGIN